MFRRHKHDWTKWEPRNVRMIHFESGKSYFDERQRRTCKTCGRIEETSI